MKYLVLISIIFITSRCITPSASTQPVDEAPLLKMCIATCDGKVSYFNANNNLTTCYCKSDSGY
jgi:hypothetical protein